MHLSAAEFARAMLLFGLAGLAEIGGGWLVWQWLRLDRPWPIGLLGALVLFGYGVVMSLQQEASFGRVYAAYGGIFIAAALAWGMLFDGFRPDRWDIIGALVAMAGGMIMMFGPRPPAS